MSERLLVIDGFSLMFRAFYGLPVTMTWKGTPINAVYGFMNLLFNAIETFQPTHLCLCFDRKEPTFRHEKYTEYKAHRPAPPEEFRVQVPILLEVIADMDLPCMDCAGFEADDLMGTLSKEAELHHWDVLLLTGDQDAFQLVSEHTVVLMGDRKSGELITYTSDKVKEKMGVHPHQVIDFKALKGDSSDNIPGVPGVGDKTAIQLIEQFGSIEQLYNRLNEVKSDKLREKLTTHKEEAVLSHFLATIKRDAPLKHDLEKLHYQPDWQKIIACLRKYDFKSLLRKFADHADPHTLEDAPLLPFQTEKPDGLYTLVQGAKEVEALLPHLKNGFAIDLETTSLAPQSAQIVGIALSWAPKQAVYIACNSELEAVSASEALSLFDEPISSSGPSFALTPTLQVLKTILEDKSVPKITHNGKYESNVFLQYGIHLQGIQFDTMLAAHLLFPADRLGLKFLAKHHLNIDMTEYETVTNGESVTFDKVPLEAATQYAAADADMTRRLYEDFAPKIKEKGLDRLFYDIELPVQDVLSEMEVEGVAIQSGYLHGLEKDFRERLKTLETDIIELAGMPFNVSSPKQLSEVLFTHLKLPVIKKTKTGISTDSSVLEKLEEQHPIAGKLLEYRMLEKLVGTYVKALPEMVHPRTQRIHTSFNQTIAQTGRLSSTNPNLQNIPIRTQEGVSIRGAFVPSRPNGLLLSADYSQIELRIMAHLAKDPHMIQAFKDDADIHAATAAIINNVPLDQVTKEQRSNAKAVNFGIIYGISAFGLSKNLGISTTDAKTIIDNYFQNFSQIKVFMEQTIAYAHEHGYVMTEWGRIRPLPEINDRNKMHQQFAERIAVNTRVQGTAAEIMKLAMLKVHAAMKAKNLSSVMTIQVHDELVFDVVPEEKDVLLEVVKSAMENAVTLSVPLKVDAVFGKSWLEASA